MILYKYKSDSKYTENIFTEKKVWLSNAKNLNDPFECTITEIAGIWIKREVKRLKGAHIDGFVMGAILCMNEHTNFYDLTPKQTKKYLNKLKTKSFNVQYKEVRDFIFNRTGKEISNPEDNFINLDSQLNEVGIFSLTELETSELMWAHYSDSSKGIAIGFERNEGSKLADPFHCNKVNYSDKRPDFTGKGLKLELTFTKVGPNFQRISFKDPTFRQAISTKNISWSYEYEWRYIEPLAGSYNLPGKIKEVIFGLNCPKNIRNKYKIICEDNFKDEITFYEIIIPKNSLNLVKKILD